MAHGLAETRRSGRVPWVVCACLVTVAALTGCAERVFRAAELPPEFQAAPRTDQEEIQLSKLGNYASSSQRIECGDVLEVTMLSDYRQMLPSTMPVRVAEDGTANIPLVGPVAVAGLELPDAERAISAAAQVRQIFERPHITVTMKQPRMNRVMVLGAVAEPGAYELPRNSSTLLAALVASGGLKEEAGPEVEIRHADPLPAPPPPSMLAGGAAVQPVSYDRPVPGNRITRVHLATASTEGGDANRVHDGDVIMVHKRDVKPVYVMGLVQKPGGYELPPNQDIHLLDALAMAGERTSQYADKVYVIRRCEASEQPLVIEVSVNGAKRDGRENLLLQPGDVISVEETPVTAVVDAFKNFFRIGFNSAIPLF